MGIAGVGGISQVSIYNLKISNGPIPDDIRYKEKVLADGTVISPVEGNNPPGRRIQKPGSKGP